MGYNLFHESDYPKIEAVFRRGGDVVEAAKDIGRSVGSLRVHLSRKYGGVRQFCHLRGFRYNQKWSK